MSKMKVTRGLLKNRIVVFLLLLIMLFSVINFLGVNIKLSKDHQYAVIVLPYDLSIDSLRLVNITVVSLTGEKTSWDLPKQRREHFRACYWGNDDKLWIDGEFGIVLHQFVDGDWQECPVIGMDEDGVLFINDSGAQGSISREEIPKAIIRRLSQKQLDYYEPDIVNKDNLSEPIEYDILEREHAILEYNLCTNKRSVYENVILCEYLKEDLEFETDFSEEFDMPSATIEYFVFDFNHDGIEDFFVCFSGAAWSGTAGDSIRIYVQEKDGLKKVFRASARVREPNSENGYAPVAILDETTDGYYDFVLPWSENRIWKYNVEKRMYE